MNVTPNAMPNKKRTPVPPVELKPSGDKPKGTPRDPKDSRPKPAFVRKDHLTDRALKGHAGLKALSHQLRLPNNRNK